VFPVTEVVMTPSKKGKTTVIRIEKVKKSNLDETQVAHVAGGHHSGLVINKQIAGISCRSLSASCAWMQSHFLNTPWLIPNHLAIFYKHLLIMCNHFYFNGQFDEIGQCCSFFLLCLEISGTDFLIG